MSAEILQYYFNMKSHSVKADNGAVYSLISGQLVIHFLENSVITFYKPNIFLLLKSSSLRTEMCHF